MLQDALQPLLLRAQLHLQPALAFPIGRQQTTSLSIPLPYRTSTFKLLLGLPNSFVAVARLVVELPQACRSRVGIAPDLLAGQRQGTLRSFFLLWTARMPLDLDAQGLAGSRHGSITIHDPAVSQL